MQKAGYPYRFRSSHVDVVLTYAEAVFSITLAAFASWLAVHRLTRPEQAALFACVFVILGVCVMALDRAVHLAYDLRMGPTGIYFRSLFVERYLTWDHVTRVKFHGALLKIWFRDGGRHAVWVSVLDDVAALRLRGFLKGRAQRSRADHEKRRSGEMLAARL